MALIKRSRLSSGSERSKGSRPLRIPGKCQVGDRPLAEAWISDIDSEGCSVLLVTIGVTKGEPVLLYLGGEAPIAGRLKRAGQGSIGVGFDTPLGEGVLDRLLAIEPPANVVPLRGGEAS